MFRKLIQKLKHNPKTIVFTEGSDPRILEASARLLSGTFLTPILVGNREEILSGVLGEDCVCGQLGGYTAQWDVNGEATSFGVEKV